MAGVPEPELGMAAQVNFSSLPLRVEVFNHYLYTRQNDPQIKPNSQINQVVRLVKTDVERVWDKTDIPHFLGDGKRGDRAVLDVILEGKGLLKIPAERRGPNFAKEMNILFDVASCTHPDALSCNCLMEYKVPKFYQDIVGKISGKYLS